MKKCSILADVFLPMLLLLVLVGCSSPTDRTVSPFTSVNTLPGCTLSIADDSLSETGCTYMVSNASDHDISFGRMHWIEEKLNGTWYTITLLEQSEDFGYGWTYELIVLKPMESRALMTDWLGLYGALPAGEYRLVKEINDGDYLSAEFELP